MGDYYQHFLTSMSGQGLQPNHGGFQPLPPQPYQGAPVSMETSAAEAPHTAIYFPAGRDPIMYDASKPKGRKKSANVTSGSETIKHRRTRSGCFTCRSRRVKVRPKPTHPMCSCEAEFANSCQCDELRPVCERMIYRSGINYCAPKLTESVGCSKGNRECIYPDPPTSKGQRSKDHALPAQQVSPLSSTGDADDDRDTKTRLETIHDTDELEEDSFSAKRALISPKSVTTSPSQPTKHTLSEESSPDDKSLSPSTHTVTPSCLIGAPFQTSDYPLPPDPRPDWSHLPPDFQHYLDWFTSNITHYHFGLTYDTDDFFKTILPSVALESESLLNAIVGFAAYQVTLQNPNGKLQDFLKYYNRSVVLLLQSLRRREKPTVSTLLTILQLATVEVRSMYHEPIRERASRH